MAEDREHRLAALRIRLHQTAREVRTAEDWARCLRAAARLPGESWANVLLITSRIPAATLVKGYEGWRAAGRQVSRDENGIEIFSSARQHKANRDSDGDEHSHSWRDAHRVAYVWDLSQTSGQPPLLARPPSSRHLGTYRPACGRPCAGSPEEKASPARRPGQAATRAPSPAPPSWPQASASPPPPRESSVTWTTTCQVALLARQYRSKPKRPRRLQSLSSPPHFLNPTPGSRASFWTPNSGPRAGIGRVSPGRQLYLRGDVSGRLVIAHVNHADQGPIRRHLIQAARRPRKGHRPELAEEPVQPAPGTRQLKIQRHLPHHPRRIVSSTSTQTAG